APAVVAHRHLDPAGLPSRPYRDLDHARPLVERRERVRDQVLERPLDQLGIEPQLRRPGVALPDLHLAGALWGPAPHVRDHVADHREEIPALEARRRTDVAETLGDLV